MNAPERVTTARLTGERIVPEHAAELSQLMLDPRVARWLGAGDTPPTRADVVASTNFNAAEWETHGLGFWLLRDRQTSAVIGRGGLRHTRATGEGEIEIGWAIAPERWNQGLATELAELSIATAFERLGLDAVIAYTLPENLASRRVMEKTGFRYEREFVHERLPHVLYRRSRC